MKKRIYLSPPHMSGKEIEYVKEVFEENWIAPVGPHLTRFENAVCDYVESPYAVAVSSCTAGLHLALKAVGVKKGDHVICSSLTFIGSVNPILYCGGIPIFIDAETDSWNMDADLLEEALVYNIKKGIKPKAIVLVHIFGMMGNISRIKELAEHFDIPIIEDAAESLGSLYKNVHTGTIGDIGVYSFNGNKLLTTSGGGMVVTKKEEYANKIKFWSTQAKDNKPFYHHTEIGYNYRMSNVLAAIGIGQMEIIEKHIKRTREVHNYYKKHLSKYICFLEEGKHNRANMWLTCGLLSNPNHKPEDLIKKLEEDNIESRFIWKPMHQQPVLKEYSVWKNLKGSDYLFKNGICLPSGSSLTNEDLDRIVNSAIKYLEK